MKISVIGATGYVGNAVVQELAGRGHEVTAFARNTDKVFQAQNVAAVSADVNAADFAGKLAGFDAVVSAFNPGWPNPNIGADFTRGANSIAEAAKAGLVAYPLIDGGGTVKEFHQDQSGMWLLPHNDSFDPIAVSPETEIIGKVVSVMRKL